MTDAPITTTVLEQLIQPISALARDAAREILETYRSPDLGIEHKADRSPVTIADMAAHDVIDAGLRQLTPNIPVLSEECCDIAFVDRSSWVRYWLVDPLDGTRQFIKGNGQFTVNIALIDDHKPVLGVIQRPTVDVLYYAWSNGGAWRQDPQQAPRRIHCSPRPEGKWRVTSNHSRVRGRFEKFLDNLGDYEHIRMGSSIKSCMVAEGTADVYPRIGATSEWDTAAAQIIVEQAGGQIVDTAMQPLRYNTRDSLINPSFFVSCDTHTDWSRYLPGEPNDD